MTDDTSHDHDAQLDADDGARGERTVLALVRVYASADTVASAKVWAQNELRDAMAKDNIESFELLHVSDIGGQHDLRDEKLRWQTGRYQKGPTT